jgi:YD repeat-containing protein
VTAGGGTLAGAAGSLNLGLSGVPITPGTATVQMNGGGFIAAPGLAPGPAVAFGPGLLGSPMATGGASCGNPVTVSNGNMYHEFEDLRLADLRLADLGPPLLVRRTYNAQAASTPGPFGYGWTHNFASRISSSGNRAVYTTPSGGALTFVLEDGVYKPAADTGLSLAKTAAGWRLASRRGGELLFDAAGRLAEAADRNGNRLSFSYDAAGRLSSAAAPLGSQVRFQYDGAGRITSMEDHAGRRAVYDYDAEGNLAASTAPGGARTVYRYETGLGRTHLLQSIAFPGGGAASFSYAMNGRLSRTADSEGAALEFDYGPDSTAVTDPLGAVTRFLFNPQGGVTKIFHADGSVTGRKFDAAGRIVETTDEEGFATRFT